MYLKISMVNRSLFHPKKTQKGTAMEMYRWIEKNYGEEMEAIPKIAEMQLTINKSDWDSLFELCVDFCQSLAVPEIIFGTAEKIVNKTIQPIGGFWTEL